MAEPTNDALIQKIAEALTAPGKANADRVRMIARAMDKAGAIAPPEEDPYRGIRTRAIEITDLDGQPTFVTVGVVLERVESGWIPGLHSLTPNEQEALDHVLRIWEHEARRRLALLVQAYDNPQAKEDLLRRQGHVLNTDTPWVTLGEMTKAQNAYRERLKLPKHPHGECCTHYEEVAHAAMAAASGSE
jgi:hypothetical protein